MIYTIAAPLGVFVTLACLALAVFHQMWKKADEKASKFAKSYHKMQERWSKANARLAKSGQDYFDLQTKYKEAQRQLEQHEVDVWADNNEARTELRKTKRLYKEVCEQVGVMQRGLDLQQAELESLRKQSELWDEEKAKLLGEVHFLNRQHSEVVHLWNEQRERLNRQADMLNEKDRYLKASRETARKQRAHLQQIQNVAKAAVALKWTEGPHA